MSVEGAKRRVVWGRGIPSHIMSEKIFEFDTLNGVYSSILGTVLIRMAFCNIKKGAKFYLTSCRNSQGGGGGRIPPSGSASEDGRPISVKNCITVAGEVYGTADVKTIGLVSLYRKNDMTHQ